jgi:hypothetical protein
MKKIGQTQIFSVTESDTSAITKVATATRERFFTLDSLTSELNELNKRVKNPLKSLALAAFSTGEVKLMRDKEYFKDIPSYLTTFTIDFNSKTNCYVNLIPFSRITKDSFDIPTNVLFAGLAAGTVLSAITKDPARIFSNHRITKNAAIIYSRAVSKVLDKQFAISANSVIEDQIRYLLAKFYMLGCVELTNSPSVSNLALGAVTKTSPAIVQMIDDKFTDYDYINIIEFIKALRREFPRLNTLTIRSLYAGFAQMYRSNTILMLEYAPYTIVHSIFTSVNSNINNEYAFENIMGNESLQMINELSNII